MTNSANLLIVIASLIALLVVGTEDIAGSGHVAFANRGINVQTDTSQDQGCKSAGETSGITNACTSTSGMTRTAVELGLGGCGGSTPIHCDVSECNNIGCTSIDCVLTTTGFNCTTNNGVQLTNCNIPISSRHLFCIRPGTGAVNSGGVIGDDSG